LISGCPPQVVRNTLRSFPGLEHRLEFVGESKGVRFINDSKGTNVGAVAKSLEGFEKVVLIMGGRDKDGDFSILRDLIKRKAKLLILLGEAGEKIGEKLKGMTDIYKVNDFREAVDMSMAKASTGDVVLLSPGCASFDMFADFEDRGKKFKEAVREILE
jgi:UDP-N-acetylmuramoylalanine--D-glutamate ligase